MDGRADRLRKNLELDLSACRRELEIVADCTAVIDAAKPLCAGKTFKIECKKQAKKCSGVVAMVTAVVRKIQKSQGPAMF